MQYNETRNSRDLFFTLLWFVIVIVSVFNLVMAIKNKKRNDINGSV